MNKDQNHYYYNIFFEKGSRQLAKNNGNKSRMLFYDRIDVSEGIDVYDRIDVSEGIDVYDRIDVSEGIDIKSGFLGDVDIDNVLVSNTISFG